MAVTRLIQKPIATNGSQLVAVAEINRKTDENEYK